MISRFSQLLVIIFLLILIPKAAAQLKADFSLDKSESCSFLIASIKNNSQAGSSSIKTYRWELDGTIISLDNPTPPSRTFTKQGINSICLTVIDQTNASNRICKNVVIYPSPEANFDPDLKEGCAPLKVTFKNTSFSSNGKIVNTRWDLGGSANIIDVSDLNTNPSSTYTLKGKQSITISVTDDKGCVSTITKKDIINVEAPDDVIPVVNYVKTCNLPWKVEIKNPNPTAGVTYTWDLGNNKTHFGSSPDTVTYDNEGIYSLKIISQKGSCTKIQDFKDLISIVREKQLQLNIDTLCTDESITLSTNQINATDRLFWSTNGVNYVESKNLIHKFSTTGCQQVFLVRQRLGCTDTLIENCLFVKAKPIVTYAVANTKTCILPAKVQMKGTGTGSWQWSLGSQKIEALDTSFLINSFGDYTLSLNIKGENGCVVKDSFPIRVKKFEAELPQFGIEGCSPLTFTIQDSIISDLPINTYKWTIFGPDTLTFNTKSPSFIIDKTGQFDLQLIVENTLGCVDTVYKPRYLRVGIPPVPKFDGNPRDDCRRIGRTFFDLSSSYTNMWRWDLGDKSPIRLEQNPQHTYNDTGYFKVTLTAGFNGCFSRPIAIDSFMHVKAPIVGFERKFDCSDQRLQKFVAAGLGLDTVYWVVNYLDGIRVDTFKTRQIDNIRFPSFGKYLVSIYAENFTTKCTDESGDTIRITNPGISYDLFPKLGCAPFNSKVTITGRDIDSTFLTWKGSPINDNQLTIDKVGKYDPPIIIGQDINKCRDTFQLDTSLYANGITIKVDLPKSICIPDDLIAIDSSVSIFDSKIKSVWILDKDTSSSVRFVKMIAKAGDHVLNHIISDDFGCVTQTDFNVLGIDLKPKINKDSLGCTITDLLFVAGGNNPFTTGYNWTFGDSSESVSNSVVRHKYKNEGNYEVCLELVDGRGCAKKVCDSLEIIDPRAEFLAIDTEASCPPLLTTFVNKSVNATKYQWVFGDNTSSGLIDPKHIYNVVDTFDVALIAYSTENCIDTFTLKDLIKLSGPRARINPEFLNTCIPLDTRLAVSSDRPYIYIWDDDLGNVEKATDTKITDERYFSYHKPGRYRPRVIVTNDAGCSIVYESREIIVNEIKVDFEVTQNPHCDPLVFPVVKNNSTSTGNKMNFIWILEKDNFLALRTDSIPQFSLKDQGRYKMTLIGETENCLDTFIRDSAVFVASKPKASFDLPSLICESKEFKTINNSDTTLQGRVLYKWVLPSGNIVATERNTNIQIDTSGNVNLKLVIINEANCVDSITNSVALSPKAQLKLPADTILCIGEGITIIPRVSGPIQGGYFLEINDSLVCNNCAIYNLNPSKLSSLKLSASTIAGCNYVDTMIVKVADVPPPIFEIIAPARVCKDSFSRIRISPYQPEWELKWVNDKGVEICTTNCESINYKLTQNEVLRAIATHKVYRCSTSLQSNTQVEVAIPDFLVDKKTICKGDYLTLTAKGGSSYKWNVPASVSCDTCRTITFTPDREMSVALIVKSDIGCQYSDSVYVNLHDRRLIYAGLDTTVCAGAYLKLSGIGQGDFKWIAPGNSFVKDSTTSSPILQAIQSGKVYISTTIDECILVDSLNLKVIQLSTLVAPNDTICPGELSRLHIITDALSYQYKISERDAEQQFINDTLILLPSKSLNVIWTASRGSCKDVVDTSVVYVQPFVDYKIDQKSYIISLNNIKQVKAKINPVNETFYSFKWTNTQYLSCDNCPRPFISGIPAETNFKVIVTDLSTGCVLEDNLVARFKQDCTPDGFFIPNVMSLSSQSNNQLIVKAHELDGFRSLSVYDRWGNAVFRTDDPTNYWDGYYKGLLAEQGVYVVKIDAVCPDNNEMFTILGDVTVVK